MKRGQSPRVFLLMVAVLAWGPATASAQDPYNLAAPVTNLATMFNDLFGPRGIIVDSEATLPGEQSHSAHFNSDFQSNFSQFGTALVSQLVSVPLPSPASGFTYQFDATLGVFQRTTQSFGPILAERGGSRSGSRINGSRSTRWKASICNTSRRCSRTTTRRCSAAAKMS